MPKVHEDKPVIVDVDQELYQRLQVHADQLTKEIDKPGVTVQVDQAILNLVESALCEIDGPAESVPYPTCEICGRQKGTIDRMVDEPDGTTASPKKVCLPCSQKIVDTKLGIPDGRHDVIGKDNSKAFPGYFSWLEDFGECGLTGCRAVTQKVNDDLCRRCAEIFKVYERHNIQVGERMRAGMTKDQAETDTWLQNARDEAERGDQVYPAGVCEACGGPGPRQRNLAGVWLCPDCYEKGRSEALARTRAKTQGKHGPETENLDYSKPQRCDGCFNTKAIYLARYSIAGGDPCDLCRECADKYAKVPAPGGSSKVDQADNPPGAPDQVTETKKKKVKSRPLNIVAEPYPKKKPKTSSAPDMTGRTQWPGPDLEVFRNRYRYVIETTPYEKRRGSREIAEIMLAKWNYKPISLEEMAGRVSSLTSKLLNRHLEFPWLGVDTQAATYRMFYREPSKQSQAHLPGYYTRRATRIKDRRIQSRVQIIKVLENTPDEKFLSLRGVAQKAQIMCPKTQGLPVERLMKAYKEMLRGWREGRGNPPKGFIHDRSDRGEYRYAITQS